MHGPEGVGGRGDLLEDDKRLASHLERLQGHNVQDLAKLRENGVQGLFQICKKVKIGSNF